jgi:hypothetical protein
MEVKDLDLLVESASDASEDEAAEVTLEEVPAYVPAHHAHEAAKRDTELREREQRVRQQESFP